MAKKDIRWYASRSPCSGIKSKLKCTGKHFINLYFTLLLLLSFLMSSFPIQKNMLHHIPNSLSATMFSVYLMRDLSHGLNITVHKGNPVPSLPRKTSLLSSHNTQNQTQGGKEILAALWPWEDQRTEDKVRQISPHTPHHGGGHTPCHHSTPKGQETAPESANLDLLCGGVGPVGQTSSSLCHRD